MSKAYDPRMHTTEHVLNQSMIRLLGCGRSFSAHINAGKSKCDYHFSRGLRQEETAALEKAVNEVLQQDLQVTEKLLPRVEAEKLVSLGKVPDSVGPETSIRLVAVGDYDLCACIGEHVSSTGEVGVFRLLSHEYRAGVLRLRFRLE